MGGCRNYGTKPESKRERHIVDNPPCGRIQAQLEKHYAPGCEGTVVVVDKKHDTKLHQSLAPHSFQSSALAALESDLLHFCLIGLSLRTCRKPVPGHHNEGHGYHVRPLHVKQKAVSRATGLIKRSLTWARRIDQPPGVLHAPELPLGTDHH